MQREIPPLRLKSTVPADVDELIRRVIGVAIEVHSHLGPGFLESIYQRAFCHELDLRGISYECQKEIIVPYKTISIAGQRLDLLVEGKLVVELKTVESIAPIHEAQLISYLKATGVRAGVIINFRVKQIKLGLKRIVV